MTVIESAADALDLCVVAYLRLDSELHAAAKSTAPRRRSPKMAQKACQAIV
jgi:hypothetical protein